MTERSFSSQASYICQSDKQFGLSEKEIKGLLWLKHIEGGQLLGSVGRRVQNVQGPERGREVSYYSKCNKK